MPNISQRITSIAKTVWRAAQTPIHFPMYGFSGFGGDWSWSWAKRLLPGTRIDYAADAGDLWLNSIVMICLKWQARIFPEAPFVVYKRTADEGTQDENEIVKDHPLTLLIRRPNAFYTGNVLWAATLLSLMISGNSFWFVERSAAGMPIRLWWVPHWMVRPVWDPENAGEFIKAYRYHVNGEYFLYDESDFVHFRDGIDPRDQRMGISCLAAEARHICTDNDWSTYSVAMARNMGVPGVVIKPPPAHAGQRTLPQLGLPTVNLIKATWTEKYARDKAGAPMVLDTPLEVQAIGFSPKDLQVDVLRKLPEERICAALGIPAVVAGLGAGLAAASAKASHEDSQRQAYYGNIIPNQRLVAEQLDLNLLDELGDPDTEFCGFDTSRVWFLKPDIAAITHSTVEAFQGGIIKLSTALKRIGEKPDNTIDGYVWQLEGAANGAATGKPAEPKNKSGQASKPGKQNVSLEDDQEAD